MRALQFLITIRFNFSVQEYIHWVPWMLLVRRLLSGPKGADGLGLELVKRGSWKDSGYIETLKISYKLTAITYRDLLETWPEKVNPSGLSKEAVYL